LGSTVSSPSFKTLPIEHAPLKGAPDSIIKLLVDIKAVNNS
jgi:hypothetical protein